jgi:hypothetical protein
LGHQQNQLKPNTVEPQRINIYVLVQITIKISLPWAWKGKALCITPSTLKACRQLVPLHLIELQTQIVERTKSNFLWSIRIWITGKKGFGDIEDAYWGFSSSSIIPV